MVVRITRGVLILQNYYQAIALFCQLLHVSSMFLMSAFDDITVL
jgi:hypothetical protein